MTNIDKRLRDLEVIWPKPASPEMDQAALERAVARIAQERGLSVEDVLAEAEASARQADAAGAVTPRDHLAFAVERIAEERGLSAADVMAEAERMLAAGEWPPPGGHRTMTTPAERLTQGYGSGPTNVDPEERRRRKIASGYRPDAQSERLLEIQRTDPAAFATLPMTMRASVAYYRTAKEAAEGRPASSGGGIEQQIAEAQAAYRNARSVEERQAYAHRLMDLLERQEGTR